jgi:hypothetical protein
MHRWGSSARYDAYFSLVAAGSLFNDQRTIDESFPRGCSNKRRQSGNDI